MKASDLQDTIDPAKVDRIKEFARFCFKKLQLKKHPQIKLTNKIETTALGYFVPDIDTIVVVVKGRHGMDIMRTLAHELVHLKQSETRELDGNTGSPDENEANAMAGVLLRVWGKLHPEYFVEDRVFTDKEIAIMEGGGSIEDNRTYYIRKQLEQAWKEKEMKVNEILESGSPSGTSSANVGIGIAYNNKPAAQPKGGKKTKHGKLAPNALDMKGSIVTGGSIGKQSFIKR